jgi:hypothetical protein
VVETLNARCTKSQLRFVWPSILTLMNANPNNLALKDAAQAMHELKAPKEMPALPQGLGPALRKAAATVAMAALIPNELLDKEPEPAEVMVSISPGNRHEEPGIGTYWGTM